MEIFHESPNVSNFVPLSEFQSRTPGSFHDGPAVLHQNLSNARLQIASEDLRESAGLSKVFEHATPETRDQNGTQEPDAGNSEETFNVDIWVTSEYVVLA